MKGIKTYTPIYVQTNSGCIPIDEIDIGDKVYDYINGNELTVRGTCQTHINDLYQITYNDGRKDYYRLTDNLYFGNKILTVCELLQLSNGQLNYLNHIGINQSIIRYNYLHSTLYPDPYIAGALLIYGDYDDQYVNLPIDGNTADQFFSDNYQVEYGYKIKGNRTYFKYDGMHDDALISWTEFFPYYDFYVTSKKITSPILPVEYTHAPINDRWKFIRGAFDVGFKIAKFYDAIGIVNKYEHKLEALQKMLWSVGVLSNVYFNPNLTNNSNMKFCLEVIGNFDGWPGFNYNINNVENLIRNDMRLVKRYHDKNLRINNVSKVSTGYNINIVLDKPKMIYFTKNYLPRVSI